MSKQENNDRKRRIAATIAFFSEAVRFIIIPLLLLYIIMANFPLLSSGETMRKIASTLIIFGGFVAIFAAMEAYFPMGSKLRMIFGMLTIVTLCAWFWFLFTGQEISMPLGPVIITIDIVGLVMVILIAIALKGLLPIVQFFMIRKEHARKSACSTIDGKKPHPSVVTTGASDHAKSRKVGDEFEPPPPDDFLVRCPICKSEISPRDDVCPHCGAWIRKKL